ncbi:hypothetical protein [Paenibacillus taichungensis]|uniref:hypothetical protein n=1 Tax=Paenibacillus taichungensis TaxID=484184 RepID=UPI0039A25EA8
MGKKVVAWDLIDPSSQSIGNILNKEVVYDNLTHCHKNELILSSDDQKKLLSTIDVFRNGFKANLQLNCEENKNMKQLYQVIVVTKKKDIIIDEKIVASNIEEAKFDLNVHEQIKLRGLSLGDVTVIVNALGSVAVEAE